LPKDLLEKVISVYQSKFDLNPKEIEDVIKKDKE
jgi:hypothetical protein